MTDNTYNGWANYETWNWKLWMDNDAGSYEYWRERSFQAYREAEPQFDWETKESAAVSLLAAEIEQYCEDMAEQFMADQSGPLADILNAGIGRIEWREIARSLIDDIIDEVAA